MLTRKTAIIVDHSVALPGNGAMQSPALYKQEQIGSMAHKLQEYLGDAYQVVVTPRKNGHIRVQVEVPGRTNIGKDFEDLGGL